jgi:uncharacterized protein YceH (UPF0502 family)
MHHFDDLNEVQSTLQRLMNRDPALVKVLVRQPGTKESRYTHLLGDVETSSSAPERDARVPAPKAAGQTDRISQLESELEEMRADIRDLKQQLAAFRKQFE